MNLIYRGYTIASSNEGVFNVYKDGHVVHTTNSEKLAYNWVDGERRKEIRKKEGFVNGVPDQKV